MLNYVIPAIERMAEGDEIFAKLGGKEVKLQIQERRRIAKVICDFLQNENDKESYFEAVAQLLKKSEYRRLALYLPLAHLQCAPNWFRKVYTEIWYELLGVRDARENFFEGHTFEVDARPAEKFERVVKCAHLTPWLVEAGYFGYSDLNELLEHNQNDEVLLRSFANTWRFMEGQKLLTEKELRQLASLTARVAQRAQLKPLYISEGRKKWLRERNQPSQRENLVTPKAKLVGPFSPNMKACIKDLELIQDSLESGEIALVGGSRLKGYGVKSSDFDVFKLRDLTNDPIMKVGSPHAVHVYFNTFWIGSNETKELKEIAANYAMAYFGQSEHKRAIERLESDLLQYRLLHKGYARFYGRYKSAAQGYAEMDGNCPFYDDRYRKIATELFAKYIFIPA